MSQASNNFQDLGLPDTLLQSISDLGYETASPIQAQAIPSLLKGRDVLGQAQTGTGKTAAFALPILARVDTKSTATQVLVLAPTRELYKPTTPIKAWNSNCRWHTGPSNGPYASWQLKAKRP